ncbi:MAG: cupin domain-containing protein [Cyclobacteriaceae bacterium]
MNSIEEIVKQLDLLPHPEGGFYRETYRSKGNFIPKQLEIESERSYSTAIYFMLTKGSFSAFHRIKQDEIWHFYAGHPIKLHMISPNGHYTSQLIGINFAQGELPQFMVPANYWFASEVKDHYALAGCTVAPGFDFEDFDLADRQALIKSFPDHHEIITRLTR